MTKYISILRGINVGGKRKILMDDLKSLYSKLGFSNSISYIQSGNIIFESKDNYDIGKIEDMIQKVIEKTFHFNVPVIVRTIQELQESISNNPYLKGEGTDIERLHLTFLKELPPTENLEKLKSIEYTHDKFEIIGKNAYIFCAGKYSDSKLTNQFFESKLKVTTTTRNWKTVTKLNEIALKR